MTLAYVPITSVPCSTCGGISYVAWCPEHDGATQMALFVSDSTHTQEMS